MLLIDAIAAHMSHAESVDSDRPPSDVSDLYIQVGQPMQWKTPNGLRSFGEPVTHKEFVNTSEGAIRGFDPSNIPGGRIEEGFDCSFVSATGGADALTENSSIRVRMTVYRHGMGDGLAAVVRFGADKVMPLQELGLGPMALALIDDLRGGVLVAGPAHAGKTFTMMAMADHINGAQSGHIVTIEDPVEIRLRTNKCVISQLEVGKDVESFESGVMGSLRQSPVAVIVGEIRDRGTAHAATRVLQSGHFLIAGIHGADGVEALSTYCALHDADRRAEDRPQIARRLSGVIYQVQVRSASRLKWHVASEVISFKSNHNLRQLLSQGKWDDLKSAMESGAPGTVALNKSLHQLVVSGAITAEDALDAAYDPVKLQTLINSTLAKA